VCLLDQFCDITTLSRSFCIEDFQEKNYYDYRYLKNKGFKVVGKEVARFIKNLEVLNSSYFYNICF